MSLTGSISKYREIQRIRILYIFTHVITENNSYCLKVCFLSSLSQIRMIQNNIDNQATNLVMILLLIFVHEWKVCAIIHTSHELNNKIGKSYYDSDCFNHVILHL
jgi:hypothetical protein